MNYPTYRVETTYPLRRTGCVYLALGGGGEGIPLGRESIFIDFPINPQRDPSFVYASVHPIDSIESKVK